MGHDRKARFLGGPRNDRGRGRGGPMGGLSWRWGTTGRRDSSGDLGMTAGVVRRRGFGDRGGLPVGGGVKGRLLFAHFSPWIPDTGRSHAMLSLSTLIALLATPALM